MEKVLLGMPGAWAEDEYEVADHYTSKIGGVPDWPIQDIDISPDLLECRECKRKLCLVAQIYAPISTERLKIEERVLYLFGCVELSCGNVPQSWRVIRVQKHPSGEESNSHYQSSLPAVSVSDSDNKSKECSWGAFDFNEGDDGSDDDINLEELSRALSEAAPLASHSKKRHEPEAHTDTKPLACQTRVIDKCLPVLPCFYIGLQEEKIKREVPSVCVRKQLTLLKENEIDGDHSKEETWEEEGYEYNKALNADRAYLKFMKRLDIHPEQCFRYSYGGNPLLATGEAKESGTCSNCKKPRCYELQLMAPLIYFLQETTDDKKRSYVQHWNWITLIVYTCSESCLSSSQEKSEYEGWNVTEETILFQYE